MPLQCILCGGDHEPSGPACMANESGIDKQITKLGATKWNKLSAQTMRVYGKRLRTLASEESERLTDHRYSDPHHATSDDPKLPSRPE